uniref:Alpha 1,3-galactosyltransferase 2 n=1 Tax=Dicentrarchus labrax TaxID=13489 RepID=A0A8C4DIE6_DICLA
MWYIFLIVCYIVPFFFCFICLDLISADTFRMPIRIFFAEPDTCVLTLNNFCYFRSRRDVQTCTSWKAPIIWDGMEGSSVALTVFAVGRFVLCKNKTLFTYYVFTDNPEKMPDIKLAPQRSIKVIKVERHARWQDISMMRMKAISGVIESDIRHRCTHVFCFDVDQVFTARFGSEALGDSVAVLHAHYYRLPREQYTYDRNPKSKAYMENGDFYYHAAVFGGSWRSVKALTEACYQSIMEDKENGVEALWHDESHLNKYMWLHKPSRVLSPEYCWDTSIGYTSDIRVSRLLWAPKHYDSLRDRVMGGHGSLMHVGSESWPVCSDPTDELL